MGYRFRKSINLGGGFKINLSKSGIGYSWGIPGFRYSKLANGRERQTYSIPGTGLSYVDDVSSNNENSENKNVKMPVEITEEQVSNIGIEENSSSDEFINKINDFRKLDTNLKIFIFIVSMWLYVFTKPIFASIGLIIFITYITFRNSKMRINIEYNFDDTNARYFKTLNEFLNELGSVNKLWLIEKRYKNVDIKRNAGVDNCIARIPITVSKKLPYYLKTNIPCFCLSIKKKKIYFLPNKVLLHDEEKTIGINFSELLFEFSDTTFVEQEAVAYDSEVVDYTYQYVNKKGGPDKRYKNNPQYPVCLYGKIDIKNDDGFNLSILLSSKTKTEQAKKYYDNLVCINKDMIKRCISCNKEISIDANFCKFCGTKQ